MAKAVLPERAIDPTFKAVCAAHRTDPRIVRHPRLPNRPGGVITNDDLLSTSPIRSKGRYYRVASLEAAGWPIEDVTGKAGPHAGAAYQLLVDRNLAE